MATPQSLAALFAKPKEAGNQIEETPAKRKLIRKEVGDEDMKPSTVKKSLAERLANYKNVKPDLVGTIGRNFSNLLSVANAQKHQIEEEQLFKWRINPDGTFKKIWETSKFCLLIYTLLYLPVKVAFIDDGNFIALYWIDKGVDAIFLIDIFLTFFTPVYVKIDMVFSLKGIAKNYLMGWFCLDVLSIVPFEDIVSIFGDDLSDNIQILAKITKVFRLLRLVRLVRLFKAFDFTNSDNYFLKFMNENFKGTMVGLLLPNLLLMTFTIHFFSCCWYILSNLDDTNQNWVVINHFSNKPDFDLYIISFYFVIQTFTSCGYGDILSVLQSEIIFRMVVMIAGVFLYGIFSGRIVEYRSAKMTEQEILVKKIQALDQIAKNYGMNSILYNSVLEQLNEPKREKKRTYDFSNLTQEDLDTFEHYKFLSKFKNKKLFPPDIKFKRFVLTLGRMLLEKHFHKGQVIYNAGDPPVHFYVVQRGSVNFMMNGNENIPIMRVNDGYFGEYELIKNKHREFTVIANTDCVLFVMDPSDFKSFFLVNNEHPQFTRDFQFEAEERNSRMHFEQDKFEKGLPRKAFWRLALKGYTRRKKATTFGGKKFFEKIIEFGRSKSRNYTDNLNSLPQ